MVIMICAFSRLEKAIKKSEYADLAIKLCDNYCAHDHEETDIVSVEEHDDIEYAEKETHTTDVLAVRFYGHVFAVFLDDLNEKNWHERFRDDDSLLYPVDTYDMAFDDNKEAESE